MCERHFSKTNNLLLYKDTDLKSCQEDQILHACTCAFGSSTNVVYWNEENDKQIKELKIFFKYSEFLNVRYIKLAQYIKSVY